MKYVKWYALVDKQTGRLICDANGDYHIVPEVTLLKKVWGDEIENKDVEIATYNQKIHG